jgi:hypothetical protein
MSRAKKSKENPANFPLFSNNVVNLKRFAYPDDKTWSCFNASIGYSPKKGYAMAFRSSNYTILPHGELHVTVGGKIRNKIFFAEIDEQYKLTNFHQIEVPETLLPTPRGIEDPRLFWRGNNWYLAAVMMEEHTPVARFCICKLDAKAKKVLSIEIYDGVQPQRPEKNWLVPDIKKNSHFDFLYGPTSIVKGDKVIFTMSENEILAGLRGNSHLVEQEDGTYLAIMHKLWISKNKGYSETHFGIVDWVYKNYGHYLVRFDQFGTMTEISTPFQFISPGIEFVGGMVEMNENLVVSFGKEDVSSHLAILSKKDAIRMLRPIEK